MTDLELFKEITRAVTGVSSLDSAISGAVARVRALFAVAPQPDPELAPRAERRGPDRLESGGMDREG